MYIYQICFCLAQKKMPVKFTDYDLQCVISLNVEHKQFFLDLICINVFTNMKNISVSVGLIDYNFHCFRKAIQEVFEVRMKVVRSRKHQSHMQKNKRPTPNGTPRMPL